jgi:hypothetical protein
MQKKRIKWGKHEVRTCEVPWGKGATALESSLPLFDGEYSLSLDSE